MEKGLKKTKYLQWWIQDFPLGTWITGGVEFLKKQELGHSM